MSSIPSVSGGGYSAKHSTKVADISKKLQKCMNDIEVKQKQITAIRGTVATLKKRKQSLDKNVKTKSGGFTNNDPIEIKDCLVSSIVGCQYNDVFVIIEILREENKKDEYMRFMVERVNGDIVIDITLLLSEIPRKMKKIYLFCKKHSAVIGNNLIGTDINKDTDKTFIIQELENDFFELSNEVTIIMENLTLMTVDDFLNIQEDPSHLMIALRALKVTLNTLTDDMVKNKVVNQIFSANKKSRSK